MIDRNTRGAAIDFVLKSLALGTITGVVLMAPNSVIALGKPMEMLFSKLDKRQQSRELSRMRSYLKTQGYVRGDYDHGITLTQKAKKRVAKLKFKNITIPAVDVWDHKWRIVMFDIPEYKRDARVALTTKMKLLKMQLLQQSVWIHPFPCYDEIAFISKHYEVENWVTYIETNHIDHEQALIKRFSKVIKK